MADILSDQNIRQLIAEKKCLPPAYNVKIQVKPKRGHKERELEITGEDGNEFCLILRESSFNHLDFSIILAYKLPQSNVLFRLRRYNGKSHEHTNLIECSSFMTTTFIWLQRDIKHGRKGRFICRTFKQVFKFQ